MLDLIEDKPTQQVDTLLVGGTVIDPETGLHGVRNVGIINGVIAYVGRVQPPAKRLLNVSGFVVAPGFIDIHSHAQSTLGNRFQSLDGVTTALELEAGTLDVAERCAHEAERGRPINFGYSASWALARMKVMDGLTGPDLDENVLLYFEAQQAHQGWHSIATSKQIDEITDLLDEQMANGAIGIGTLLGYSPESGRIEYFRMAVAAAKAGLPVFTHIRSMYLDDPDSNIEATLELVSASAGSAAHMHMCHVNSTGGRNADTIIQIMDTARAQGNHVSFEYYPYTASSTGIGAAFFHPDKMPRTGRKPTSIFHIPKGRRVRDTDDLRRLREADPGALCICDYLDPHDDHDVAKLLHAMTTPGVAAASDAMPVVSMQDPSRKSEAFQWPADPDVFTHPRSVGCFSKVLRWGYRELGIYSLDEAIARCSTIPAKILEQEVPAFKRKGRIQAGADADIVIFDPDSVSDRATFEKLEQSFGYEYVFVNGETVVHQSEPVLSALPGRAITSTGH
jgi:N-acyl-D-aspartate/D-glutamate deacylase